ncbi:MAG: DUF59 domain-containing protein [Acidobacteriota bacterium]|nr:DUF59 domain-containing protein [Acidobacteriota bacterium]
MTDETRESVSIAGHPSDPLSAAWDALSHVYDPELYLDIVALGLVYDVAFHDEVIEVEMTLTTLGCPAAESLPELAREAVAHAVGPSVAVNVTVVWDPPWSPERIDADAAAALGFRR